MDPHPPTAGPPPMHEASRKLRRVLVLNEVIEYWMRVHLKTNDTDFQAMQHLLQARSMSPSDLARALHLTTAATTTVVNRLVMAGHARRVPHPTDGRRWLVQPTPSSAREAMELLMPMILRTDRLVRGMGEAEQSGVVAYLDGVVAAMEERIADMSRIADQPAVGPAHRTETTP